MRCRGAGSLAQVMVMCTTLECLNLEASRPVPSDSIMLEIKGHQHWTLTQHSGHNISPVVVEVIAGETEPRERCILSALLPND